MRMVLVTLDFPPTRGGIQRYLHEIVMHTFHHDDVVLTYGTSAHTLTIDAYYPCRIIRIPFFSVFNNKMALIPMFLALFRLLVKEKTINLVIGGNIYAALLPFLLSTVRSCRYMVHCYGTELKPLVKRYAFSTFIWKSVLRHAGMVVYLTGATRKLLVDCLGEGPYVQQVPRIDLPDFTIADKRHEAGTMRILSVGRLVPHKGHSILIDAVRRIPPEISWSLTIVGDGPDYQYLSTLVHRYALEKKVSILTSVADPELSMLYKECTLFILPSIETEMAVEGFGIVLLEAMAYGVAIIATLSGGIPEVFSSSDECAELVPPGNQEALCNAIIALSSDVARRQHMVRNARNLLEQRYVWK